MKGKITAEIRGDMIKKRKEGHTYKEIEKALGVSRWACIKYLKDIKIDKSWVEQEWRKAQNEAATILEDYGFTHIIDLNNICSSPYWDYYCEKNGEKWLIDVTINTQKDAVDKIGSMVEGYHCAILLKDNGDWGFFEISMRKMVTGDTDKRGGDRTDEGKA